MKNLARGFGSAFRGISYLLKNTDLWPFAALPVLINVVIFAGGLWAYIHFFPQILHYFVDDPAVWWQWIVYVLVVLVLIGVAALVSIFGFTVAGCVIAAPFLDTLSEKVEAKEGRTFESAGVRGMVADILRGLKFAVLVLVLFAVTQLMLVALWLVPGVGGIVYAVLAPLGGAFFFALEFFNLPLNRRRIAPRDQLSFAWRHKTAAVGFGLAVFLTTLVPLLNFLLLPAAAVGATLLIRQLEDEKANATQAG